MEIWWLQLLKKYVLWPPLLVIKITTTGSSKKMCNASLKTILISIHDCLIWILFLVWTWHLVCIKEYQIFYSSQTTSFWIFEEISHANLWFNIPGKVYAMLYLKKCAKQNPNKKNFYIWNNLAKLFLLLKIW